MNPVGRSALPVGLLPAGPPAQSRGILRTIARRHVSYMLSAIITVHPIIFHIKAYLLEATPG